MATAGPLSGVPVDISGSWDLSVKYPNITEGLDLDLKQTGTKITGTVTGGRPVRGNVVGSNVTIIVSVEALGVDGGLDQIYKGKLINKNTMSGSVTMPGIEGKRPGAWVAKRQ